MRKTLMEIFDEIYILNLHGDTRKKEVPPDGGKDENVFDIMQGVSINIFVKKKQSVILSEARKGEVEESLAKVYHYEIFGKRFEKYASLAKTSFSDIPWEELSPQAPQYFFVPKDFSVQEEYECGFKVDELIKICNSGIQTKRDALNIFFNQEESANLRIDFTSMPADDIARKYNVKDGRDWQILSAKNDLIKNENITNRIVYKPFDVRYTNYTGKTNGIMGYPRFSESRHVLKGSFALVLSRQYSNNVDYSFVLCVNRLIPDRFFATTNGTPYFFPLYLYPTEGEEKLGETRKPNLDEKIWRKIDKCTKLETTPEQIFDYIYGVLHTPSYREKYKEFLKIDFPRIPYPENKEDFERIVSIGNKLRKLHLMEEIPPQATSFDIEGDNAVTELRFEKEKVYINKTQYFGNVPELAWNFYIGGYQPAQKWLKDRKNRTFTFDDISHYRKIIAILIETHKLMQNLDETAR